MTEDEIKRTDAKIRLGLLGEAKRELLTKVKEQEKSLKILLSQVKTMQRLIEEAQSDIQAGEKEHILKVQEEIDEQTEVLEEMLEDTKKSKKDAFDVFGETPNHMYQGTNEPNYRLNENVLTMAASAASTDRLHELKYKSNWSDNDAKEFFSIYNSVKVSQDYKLNDFVQDNINQTNTVLQDVLKKQEKQIQQHYKPTTPQNNFGNTQTSYQPKTNYESSKTILNPTLKKLSGLEKAVDKK